MITLITGAPGAGKSAGLVELLGHLAKDRLVYVNGVDELLVDHIELSDPKRWPELVPDGAVIAVDEVQRIWRPRGPGQKTPAEVEAFETHRHRGLDFYLLTQAPKLLDANIRALVGRHVHLRDVGILGRYWYEWPECNPELGFKNAPIKKRWKLPKSVFSQYKSASVHIKPLRSFPMALAVVGVAIAGMAVSGWYVFNSIRGKVSPKAPAAAQAASAPAGQGVGGKRPAPRLMTALDYRRQSAPVVPGRPETAPMFDHLRTVQRMPEIQGGFCSVDHGCRCYVQGGLAAPVDPKVCSEWVASPPFNPYARPAAAPARPAPPPQPQPSPTV